jgi:hypothetical protein
MLVSYMLPVSRAMAEWRSALLCSGLIGWVAGCWKTGTQSETVLLEVLTREWRHGSTILDFFINIPQPLYPQGKSPQYPDGAQSWSGCCRIEKDLYLLLRLDFQLSSL